MVTKRNRKGFTLIELLVVIAIIGLLSTLAVVALGNAQARARDSKRAADIKQIQTALALYYNENSGYPFGQAVADADGDDIGGDTDLMATQMAVIPTAPGPADGTGAGACTTATNSYTYESTLNTAAECVGARTAVGTCAGYELEFCLGGIVGGTGGLAAGIHCAGPNSTTNAACVFTD